MLYSKMVILRFMKMPSNDYVCSECDYKFEVVQRIAEDSLTTCPKCSKKMDFVWSGKGEPPPRLKFGERIGDWNYISASVSRQ